MNDTTYIHARVTTNAKRESVKRKTNMFYIDVKEKAERGSANAQVKKILSQQLACEPNCIRLIKGAHSPSKTYLLINKNHHEN